MKRLAQAAAATALSLAAASVAALALSDFKDPDDGALDLSNWLLTKRGLLPVPIIITEPAVGYGGGLAVAFFRDSIANAAQNKGPSGATVPPDIYGAALAATENGTKVGGAGAMMSFAGDRIRYRGGLGAADVNLAFYGLGRGDDLKIDYSLKGWATMQQVLHRLGSSDAWVSARWIYLDLKNSLDPEDRARTRLQDVSFARRASGLGSTLEYDSRDNIFTPNRGWNGSLDFTFYDKAWGSSYDFQSYRGHAFGYWPLFAGKLVVGGRIDGRAARGDVPFFMLPFVDLRGVPAMRLQNRDTGVLESELRWNVTPRWSLIGMIGAGRAWGDRTSFSDASTAVSKGLGFRYLIARRLGLYAGLDVARSNYDRAFYLTIGSAWR